MNIKDIKPGMILKTSNNKFVFVKEVLQTRVIVIFFQIYKNASRGNTTTAMRPENLSTY